MLTAALVLAVMILPIMTAVCREVFLQTPRLHEEAALALGRHPLGDDPDGGAARTAAPGSISGAMLGLGRALGETLAVTIILSVNPTARRRSTSSARRTRRPSRPTSRSTSPRPPASA